MLTAEPGLDAWWETVVQIMTQVYKAERVTLSIPADVTDIENVPWGQKATYNEHQEDGFSLGYMGRSNASEAPPPRPNLSSRHSFNTFEESKDRADISEQPGRRPAGLSRSKSYMPSAGPAKPDRPHPALNQTALQQLAAADENDAPAWEATLGQRQVTKARVLPVLQALDYEADPLIDHASVMRVLERGKVIALTRTYPYLQPGDPQEPAGPRSPAPSPAVRPDPKENPFFTDAVVDEDSFNPDTTTADYSSISPPEAIGIDNSSSVLHIPLNHVLLSRMPRPFFDATPIPGSGAFGINRDSDAGVPGKTPRCDPDAAGFGDGPRVAPLAILSILSPETAAPSGFGALASDGRPIANAATLSNMIHLHPGELPTQSSLAGSMTSLSEYSGVSRSAVGSPIATPGLERVEQATLGILADRIDKTLVTTSPLPVVEDGYFSAKHTPVIARSDYSSSSTGHLVADPWGSIHEEDRDEYLKAWGHCLRTGEQFSRTVRIRRFDGAYRWFYARAVASRDKRGVIHHFLGSYMDIHDQRLAEVKAARQEQIAASEAKHKLLANLIPQIIFTATDNSGITSANEQWLSYTGQSFEDSLGLGFMDYIAQEVSRAEAGNPRRPLSLSDNPAALLRHLSGHVDITTTDNLLNMHLNGKANAGASGKREAEVDMAAESPISDLNGLARMGVIKVARDSNGRLSYTTEVRLRSKSGEYRWHLVRCVEIDNVDFGDGASSYFGSATDINDHKLLEAKLKEAMESKSRFLSNMSHEIRTPLIGISGMVSFLQDTQLDEEQRDYTNTIQTSANSLLMIINDILDLSKVAAGMMKLKFEWFHTRSLIEDVNELVSTMAIAKRLELNYIVDEDVPAWVKGDKIRIRQVLLNVIGNAIKFTTVGEVFSRCRVYREASESPKTTPHELTLEFAIIDTGRGFTKEEAELIFKPFSQIDGSSTRQHGGSGLGLVISRQLVELHGGKMEGSAVPGKGSTFTFTAKFGLPTEEDHPQFQPSPASLAADELSQVDTVPPLPSIGPAQPSRSRTSSHASPDTVADMLLASGPLSSGSSNPSSAESGLSMLSGASSVSSIKAGLGTPVGVAPDPRPLVYSILIVCPQTHSREATSQHIATTLPKDVPYQIRALDSTTEAAKVITSEDGHRFTHIVLNLPTAEEVISLVELTTKSNRQQGVTILVLSDTVQRQQVMRLASGTACEKLLREKQITFIYKPVKPSRFAVIFDPDKASYLEIEKRMGNKGYRVLLVEDNPVNQKVLTKYLKKVGVGVDIATDGMDCVDMVFSRPYGYYSLILCDLHMPRKDGYQACREVREWEKRKGKGATMPIIALSANVMSDVQDKCLAAGFSEYVTKPVDFIDLSRAMSKFF
ncbi:unnamed protein product [Parascedosporium putredinis]|uniref:histidine kinase n=1 Tax=Parascedosporium putredinis TaxID=1442378 RepID=A0A9P1MED2_9PEZI|nr:unnamed protein product [Parascedosporium putredinis]CAI8001320.1 unnamed protein product [Parascedosporium putredinis]